MRTAFYPMLVFGLTLLFVTACGEGEMYVGPEANNAKPAFDAPCSSEFISDYNEIVGDASIADSATEISTVKLKISEFKTKYPSMSCKAEVKKVKGLGNEEIIIDSKKKMDEFLKILDSASNS